MNLAELEKHHSKNNPSPPTPDPEGAAPFEQGDQALKDILEAIPLLAMVKTILDYVSNPSLVKTLSKRERANMEKVSEKVRRFLATIEPTYAEEEFE